MLVLSGKRVTLDFVLRRTLLNLRAVAGTGNDAENAVAQNIWQIGRIRLCEIIDTAYLKLGTMQCAKSLYSRGIY